MKGDCRTLIYESTSPDKNVPIIKIFVLYGASVKSLNLIQYMKETITQKEKMKKSLYATSLGDGRRNVYQVLDLEKKMSQTTRRFERKQNRNDYRLRYT